MLPSDFNPNRILVLLGLIILALPLGLLPVKGDDSAHKMSIVRSNVHHVMKRADDYVESMSGGSQEPIDCYHCEEGDSSMSENMVFDCTPFKSSDKEAVRSGCTSCSKVTLEGELLGIEVKQVQRHCIQSLDDLDDFKRTGGAINECRDLPEVMGFRSRACLCSKELCNTAPHTSVSAAPAMLYATISILVSVFRFS